MAKPGFARYNCSIANASLGSKLRFGGAVGHPSDADEVSEDPEFSYVELTGDNLTIGWNNHSMTSLEVVDMEEMVVVDDEEGDSFQHDGEVRGLYARFCAMNTVEQDVLIDDIKTHLCSLIYTHPSEWAPSTAFVLDLIEDETPEEELCQMVLDLYLADHPESVGDAPGAGRMEDEVGRFTEYDVMIPAGDVLSPRVSRGNSESRRDYRHHYDTNLREYNHRSHTRRITRARAFGKKEAHRLVDYDLREEATSDLEYDETAFLSASEREDLIVHRALIDDWTSYLEQEQKYPMTYAEFLATLEEWMGRSDRSVHEWIFFDESFDRCWDDYLMTNEMDDFGDCRDRDEEDEYPVSDADSEAFSGSREDIFEDYGDLSELFIGHSSHLRFTGRYRPTRRGLASIAAFM